MLVRELSTRPRSTSLRVKSEILAVRRRAAAVDVATFLGVEHGRVLAVDSGHPELGLAAGLGNDSPRVNDLP